MVDKLEQLFNMQSTLNNHVFAKKGINDRTGLPLTCETLGHEARQEKIGPNTETNEWLGKYLTAMEAECKELREALLWKWWSKDFLDMQNVRVEIVDQLHFWISLAITSGMDAREVFRLYMLKNEVNLKRQETGYSKETKTEADNKTVV